MFILLSALDAEVGRYHDIVPRLSLGDARVQDDLRRYLCMRFAGFLEQVTKEAVHGYLTDHSGGPVREFARSFFRDAPNLNVNAFTRLLARFGQEYETEITTFLNSPFMGKTRKEYLGDLLSVRNDVAHGRVAMGRKLDPSPYHRLCKDVYGWLLTTLLTSAPFIEVETLDS